VIPQFFLIILLFSPVGQMLHQEMGLVPRNFLEHLEVCIMDVCGIDIYIVENMPNICSGMRGNILGCAVYSGPIKIMFLKSGFIQDRDMFGLTTFEHEALHLLCECDFHVNQSMTNAVIKSGEPYEYVLKYKALIRTGKSFDNV
jgi:hypothetical protein